MAESESHSRTTDPAPAAQIRETLAFVAVLLAALAVLGGAMTSSFDLLSHAAWVMRLIPKPDRVLPLGVAWALFLTCVPLTGAFLHGVCRSGATPVEDAGAEGG